MKQRVIYVFTHDSIGLGEDGPTHQPIEQLSALRAIPDLTRDPPGRREGDGGSVARRDQAQERAGGLVLTRQKLGFIDRDEVCARPPGSRRARYVLADAPGGAPEVVLMSTGSEVALVLGAADEARRGRHSRARGEHAEPRAVRGTAGEYQRRAAAGRTSASRSRRRTRCRWYRWVGNDGDRLGIDRFGASAPYADIYKGLGLTVDKLVEAARGLVAR